MSDWAKKIPWWNTQAYSVLDKHRKFYNLILDRKRVFLFEGSDIDLNESNNWCFGEFEE